MKKEIKEKIIEILKNINPITTDEKDVDKIADQILELLEAEYKNGYNQCLKDLGKTGERWLHLYL